MRNDTPRRDTRETREVDEDARPSDESVPIQTAFFVTRPEDFYNPEHLQEPLFMHSRWENFPSAMVINGGGFNDLTINSTKRKLDELVDTAPPQTVTFERVKDRSEPIPFYLEELPKRALNSAIPLLIRARMANFDVHRILINEGSSIDVMYNQLFQTLQLDDSHLSAYMGSDLQDFNDSTSKP